MSTLGAIALGLFCISGFTLGLLLLLGLCRAARDTRPVDEGQAFGGDYE